VSDAGFMPASVVLVGAGKMGGAMLEGWLSAGLAPASATVLDPFIPADFASSLASRGVRVNPASGSAPEVLVLATKPQSLDEAVAVTAPYAGADTAVVSILAGKTVADLRARFPAVSAVIRAMPNLPASIGRGATGAYASPETSPAQRAAADALLRANGVVAWVEREDLIDAVTALSGSGPAYVFHLVECMAQAGMAAGLPEDLAERLARATVEGAGELLHRSDLSPETLRRNVTSPGGTTAAALAVLMGQKGLEPLMVEAVAAAKRRAGELSG
jgi:pyrroline-5-carboxylate reductase